MQGKNYGYQAERKESSTNPVNNGWLAAMEDSKSMFIIANTRSITIPKAKFMHHVG